jgi:curved DNA-binding protein CbpA
LIHATFVYVVRLLYSIINHHETGTSRVSWVVLILDLFMDTFTDYYTVLGVKPDASASTIKTAFKKLALQYHPDIYKGEDAQERMRVLLLAYQTLIDPASRRAYDARRSEHFFDAPRSALGRDDLRDRPTSGRTSYRGRPAEVSPSARRDRQRHYDFSALNDGLPARVDLGDFTYDLSAGEVQELKQQGMLRGIAPEASGKLSPEALENYPHRCHRCHHRWIPFRERGNPASSAGRRMASRERVCPACKADDWGEYLLLRCTHCHAVFESEQIRYEIGSYNYSDRSLCPPYELFPLCPYCGASGWCPAEDVRVSELRAKAEQRAVMLRLLWFGIAAVTMLVLAVVILTTLKP